MQWTYQAKWAKALLASAMRWTFSRLVMAAPSRLKAAINSSASFSCVARPFFLADRLQNPANRQRLLPIAADLHRHLIGGTADALGADFDGRLHVFHRLRERPRSGSCPRSFP